VTVSVKVKNTGEMAGKEIVQLYVRDVESSVIRPEKELKGFEKVELQPGEEKTVTFELDKRAFAYYNVDIGDWHVETGEFEIMIGKSSRDIVLKDKIFVKSTVTVRKPVHRNTLLGDLLWDPVLAPVFKEFMNKASQDNPMFASIQDEDSIMAAMMRYMPLRAVMNFGRGKFTEEMLEGLIQKLNEKLNEQ